MILKPARLLLAMIAMVSAPVFAQNIATVNGKPIPAAKVDQVVKQVVAQGRATDSPQLREAVKRDLIGREVLIQEADKQGIGARAEVKSQIDNARQSILINAMLMDHLKKNPVKDADVKAEYDRVKAETANTKEYKARHILVETEDQAKAIITKLKGGAKFEELAKQSKDPGSAANGGDLDWVDPGKMVPEFSKAMVALQKGAITEAPVKSQFGYHVIKLEDVRPVKFPTLEQAKPQVTEAVQQKKIQAFREGLMKKAKIQ
jgi:peptidyl-prolyl cis-trans isomerase C